MGHDIVVKDQVKSMLCVPIYICMCVHCIHILMVPPSLLCVCVHINHVCMVDNLHVTCQLNCSCNVENSSNCTTLQCVYY